jgi:hypothetical protein
MSYGHIEHPGAYASAVNARIRRNGVKGRLDRLAAAATPDDALIHRFISEIVDPRGQRRNEALNAQREREAKREGWDFEPYDFAPLIEYDTNDQRSVSASWIASLEWDELDGFHFEQSIALRYVKSPKGLSDKMRALVERMLDEEPRREEAAAERKRARQEADAASTHVGNVGDRLKDVEMVVEFTKSFEGYYGSKMIVKFRDLRGNVFVTFGTSNWLWECERGQRYLVTGTVKSHDEYEGTLQTQLTRTKGVAYTDGGN